MLAFDPYKVPYVAGCDTDVSGLPMDHALLQVEYTSSELPFPEIKYVYDDCYDCTSTQMYAGGSYTDELVCFTIPTAYGTNFHFKCNSDDGFIYSSVPLSPKQFGTYKLTVDVTCNATPSVVDEPSWLSNALPLLLLLAYLMTVAVSRNAYKRWFSGAPEDNHPLPATSQESFNTTPLLISRRTSKEGNRASSELAAPKARPRRYQSLDAFRGLSLVLMIFVNLGGGGYYFFNHSTWNGLTVADLVFPWFIFIMGVTIALTFKPVEPSISLCSDTVLARIKVAVVRGVKLFLLGIFLNSADNNGDISYLRIPGVLQYFGSVYLYLSCVILTAEPYLGHQVNLTTVVKYALLGLAPLAIYVAVSETLSVPSCPTGYNGPGGISENSRYYDCTGGAHRYVDKVILGDNHFYGDPTCASVYECLTYDPEGIVGSFAAMLLGFFGLVAGKIVHGKQHVIRRLVAGGVVLCAIGAALCGMSENGGTTPVNKNLWSPSFVTVTAGFAYFLFAAFYYSIDVKSKWDGWPLNVVGKNSIVLYLGHEILGGYIPLSLYFTTDSQNKHWGVLMSNTIGVSVCVAFAIYLDRKKIYVSV
jgi:heparan-alpha-glucosaminide N-acetyltransferase